MRWMIDWRAVDNHAPMLGIVRNERPKFELGFGKVSYCALFVAERSWSSGYADPRATVRMLAEKCLVLIHDWSTAFRSDTSDRA